MPEDIFIGYGPISGSLSDLFESLGLYGRRSGRTKRARQLDRQRVGSEKHELAYLKYRRPDRTGHLTYGPEHRYFEKLLAQAKIRVPGTVGLYYDTPKKITPKAWRTNPGFTSIRRELERFRRTKALVNLT